MVRPNQVDCYTMDDSTLSNVSKISPPTKKTNSTSGGRMMTLVGLMATRRRRNSMTSDGQDQQPETFMSIERANPISKHRKLKMVTLVPLTTRKTVTFDPLTTVYKYSDDDVDPNLLWWSKNYFASRAAQDKKLVSEDANVKQHLILLQEMLQKFQCTEFSPEESFHNYLRPARKGFRAGFRGLEHLQIKPSKQRRSNIEAVLSVSNTFSPTQLAVFAAVNSTQARLWARAMGKADEDAAK